MKSLFMFKDERQLGIITRRNSASPGEAMVDAPQCDNAKDPGPYFEPGKLILKEYEKTIQMMMGRERRWDAVQLVDAALSFNESNGRLSLTANHQGLGDRSYLSFEVSYFGDQTMMVLCLSVIAEPLYDHDLCSIANLELLPFAMMDGVP